MEGAAAVAAGLGWMPGVAVAGGACVLTEAVVVGGPAAPFEPEVVDAAQPAITKAATAMGVPRVPRPTKLP